MNHDEQDQLWKLLGKAREPKASPFFANKVMHAVRRETKEESAQTGQTSQTSIGMWIRRWWFVPATAAACAVLATMTLRHDPAGPATQPTLAKADPLTEMVNVIADTDEFEASLSDLVATEDHSVWLAVDPSSLF